MSELENRYGIPMKQEVKEEVGNMCSYSAAIRERAEVKGRADAICILLESMEVVPDAVRTKILAEQNIETLNSWLKIAKKADSIEEFLNQTGL